MTFTHVSLKGRTTWPVLLGGFCELSFRFLKEKHLLCKTPLEFLALFLAGSSVVIYNGSKIVGHITMWPLSMGWQEVGSIWVRPQYRGFGIAKQLLGAILKEHLDEKLLLTTTNPVIMRLSEFHGLSQIRFADLPEEVHRATCVCAEKKMRSRCYQECQLQNNECKLFVN